MYDLKGNVVAMTDPMGNRMFAYTYDLADRVTRRDGADSGTIRTYYDGAGNAIELRDDRGALVLRSYDAIGRPSDVWARDAGGESVTLRERVVYGDSQADVDFGDARAANLLGRPWRHYDEAGLLTLASYDHRGNAVERRRRFVPAELLLADPDGFRTDWDALALADLDAHEHWSDTAYDALDRVAAMTFRALDQERRMLPVYNAAGAIESVALDGTKVVERIAYNANGQRTLIVYGSLAGAGILTRSTYTPDSFRLQRMRTERLSPNEAIACPDTASCSDVPAPRPALQFNDIADGVREPITESDPTVRRGDLRRAWSTPLAPGTCSIPAHPARPGHPRIAWPPCSDLLFGRMRAKST